MEFFSNGATAANRKSSSIANENKHMRTSIVYQYKGDMLIFVAVLLNFSITLAPSDAYW
jgi:hypothetical protein